MNRQLWIRHFRQFAELAGPEAYLDRFSPEQAVHAAAGLSRARAAVPAAKIDAASPALVTLGEQAAGCVLCRLHEQRSRVVFGEGNPRASVVVVGEAPGQEEDRTGRPFVGRAGRLLDLMLQAVALPRPDVYICNVLKCRPPGNRNPQADEIAMCTSHFLFRQLELIEPEVILAVGRFAAQALLETQESIGRLRGRVHTWRGIPLLVSYHPAYLLRSPDMVRIAWGDLQMLRKVLDEQA